MKLPGWSRRVVADFFTVYWVTGILYAGTAIYGIVLGLLHPAAVSAPTADNTYLYLLLWPAIFWALYYILASLKLIARKTYLGLMAWTVVFQLAGLLVPNGSTDGQSVLYEVIFCIIFAVVFVILDRVMPRLLGTMKWYRRWAAEGFYEGRVVVFLKKYWVVFWTSFFGALASFVVLKLLAQVTMTPLPWRYIAAVLQIVALSVAPIATAFLYWLACKEPELIAKRRHLILATLFAYAAFCIAFIPTVLLFHLVPAGGRIFLGIVFAVAIPFFTFLLGVATYREMITMRADHPGRLDEVNKLFADSWKLYASRFGTLIGIIAIPYVLQIAGQIITRGGTSALLILGVLIVVIADILGVVAAVALIFAIAEGTGFADSYRRGFKLFWPLVWISILASFVQIGGMAMLLLPGLLAGVWLMFHMFTFALEGKRGLGALVRSREYARGYWWGIFGRVVLIGICILVPFAIILLPTFFLFGPIVALVVYAILILFVAPFSIAYNYVIYRNLVALKPTLPEERSGTSRRYLAVMGVMGIIAIVAIICGIVAFRRYVVANTGNGAASGSVPAALWQRYNAADDSWSVMFPTPPASTTQYVQVPEDSVPLEERIAYSEEDNGTTYFVGAVTYPSRVTITNVKTALQGVVDGSAQGVGGTVATSSFITYMGSPAIDYGIVAGDNSYLVRGRDVMDGPNLYQVFVICYPKDCSENDYDTFVNSFRF